MQRKLTVVNRENRIDSYDTPTVQKTRPGTRTREADPQWKTLIGQRVFWHT